MWGAREVLSGYVWVTWTQPCQGPQCLSPWERLARLRGMAMGKLLGRGKAPSDPCVDVDSVSRKCPPCLSAPRMSLQTASLWRLLLPRSANPPPCVAVRRTSRLLVLLYALIKPPCALYILNELSFWGRCHFSIRFQLFCVSLRLFFILLLSLVRVRWPKDEVTWEFGGDSPVSKVLVLEVWEPRFSSQYPHKNPKHGGACLSPRYWGKWRQEDPWDSLTSPAGWIDELQAYKNKTKQKTPKPNKIKNGLKGSGWTYWRWYPQGRISGLHLCAHTWVDPCIYLCTCIYTAHTCIKWRLFNTEYFFIKTPLLYFFWKVHAEKHAE